MSSDLRPPFRRPPKPSSAKGKLSSHQTDSSRRGLDSPEDSQRFPEPSTPAQLSSPAPAEEVKAAQEDAETERTYLEPIPPPGEEMQYRAIGLIEGQYIPSPEQFTRGILRTPDGLDLDAVLLGRVMSLVRKHLEPERNYLWVVYPRTREKTEDLHVQLMGVWAPEEMGQPLPEGSRSPVVPDWFSIRGEVVFQSQEKGFIIVKIRQAGKKSPSNRNEAALANSKPQAFKLRLIGSLPSKGVGSFWDLQVRRQGSLLYVEAGTPIGPVIKTPPRPRLKRSTPRPQIKKALSKPASSGESIPEQFYSPRDPAQVPKPIKKKRP
ncbi:hypothetical protein L1047_03120 [Synechococcus sp. Nb3U1]|uniref:hypothetical protein n=1 Tax=Synechococcus sp. Nb3U1 TaxID=1914529 RepID=UPI001F3FB36A|nr:hypothetical protein [Synechococcus sp. Nb3U1]MCF2970186.1 hypothetical protein [Synechococcus sp. Nb3U1]